MPDRVIRDEIMKSERYWSLKSDTTRLLFIHLLLTADDFGNAEASNWALRRLAPHHEDVEGLLCEWKNAELVRTYEVNNKRYLHILRFRQRKRHTKRAHPRPPAEIDDIPQETSDARQAYDGRTSVEEKRCEEKGWDERREEDPETVDALQSGHAKYRKEHEGERRVETCHAIRVADLVSDGLTANIASELLYARKAKRAPLTSTAWEGLKCEFKKAKLSPEDGVCLMLARGWARFEAKWGIDAKNNNREQSIGHFI